MTNKSNQIYTKYIYINPQKCKACWKCPVITTCPNKVIGRKIGFLHKHIVIESADKCSGCKKCIKVCKRKVFSENK